MEFDSRNVLYNPSILYITEEYKSIDDKV